MAFFSDVRFDFATKLFDLDLDRDEWWPAGVIIPAHILRRWDAGDHHFSSLCARVWQSFASSLALVLSKWVAAVGVDGGCIQFLIFYFQSFVSCVW